MVAPNGMMGWQAATGDLNLKVSPALDEPDMDK
jgi:hypothetical protein